MKKAESISLSQIKINDSFWGKYIKLVKDVIIPYQWSILNDQVPGAEPSGCIHNFKIAAGEAEGTYQGAVFQDTDVAKWLEAVAYTLETDPDPELENLADNVIELLEKAQSEDGYLNTYYMLKEPGKRFVNLMEGHELYTAGHLIEAAAAYYTATGKRKILDIAVRFANLICSYFGSEEHQCHGYPGHQEIELALVKLFHVTGNKKYLDTAKYFIDSRGKGENYFLKEENREGFQHIFPEFQNYDVKYSQSHIPVREQTTAEGHSVRAVYMYCAMADLAYEYQDKTLMSACETLWKNMTQKRMYITGSIGSSGILERFTADYDLPNDCNYSETCASIGLALFGKRMAQITKDASYMDVVERALYNTVLAGIAMDGKSFFYVNPLEVWPDNCLPNTSKDHVKAVRQKWFSVACCPPNISRTLASLGQYIYFYQETDLYVNLFISNKMQVKLGGTSFGIEQQTEFPFENKAIFRIRAEEEQKAAIYFRVPEYAVDYKVTVNGEVIPEPEIIKGYLKIEKRYYNDKVEISFDALARYMRANPKVRADAGRAAIVKGPLVYCLEEADNGKGLACIYADTSEGLEESREETAFGQITVVKGKGRKISQESWNDHELYKEQRPIWEKTVFTAIPYAYWCNRQPGEMIVWLKEI